MGFATALHTAGANPRKLATVLPLLDWVGFDIKAPFKDYARIVGYRGGTAARTALQILTASQVAHEIRLTLSPELSATTLERVHTELASLTHSSLKIQTCRLPEPNGTIRIAP